MKVTRRILDLSLSPNVLRLTIKYGKNALIFRDINVNNGISNNFLYTTLPKCEKQVKKACSSNFIGKKS